MSSASSSSSNEPIPSGWHYYGGWFFFILSFIMPLLSPLITMFGFNKTITTILMSGFFVGGPELIMMLAIALWGKSTFNYFMGYLYKLLSSLKPANTVSAVRYYIGLVLLIGCFIPSWIISYLPNLVSNTTRIYIVIVFDVIFVISFFVLGGDFWEKIRAVFIPNPIKIIRKPIL